MNKGGLINDESYRSPHVVKAHTKVTKARQRVVAERIDHLGDDITGYSKERGTYM